MPTKYNRLKIRSVYCYHQLILIAFNQKKIKKLKKANSCTKHYSNKTRITFSYGLFLMQIPLRQAIDDSLVHRVEIKDCWNQPSGESFLSFWPYSHQFQLRLKVFLNLEPRSYEWHWPKGDWNITWNFTKIEWCRDIS